MKTYLLEEPAPSVPYPLTFYAATPMARQRKSAPPYGYLAAMGLAAISQQPCT